MLNLPSDVEELVILRDEEINQTFNQRLLKVFSKDHLLFIEVSGEIYDLLHIPFIVVCCQWLKKIDLIILDWRN